MIDNTNQLLRDPMVEPNPEVIAAGLGAEANKVYLRFLEQLREQDISLMDWRFYRDGMSWLTKGEYRWVSKRGAQKAKPIFWLSIWNGFFKVSFHFAHAIPEGIFVLPLSAEGKKILQTTNEIKGNVTWKSLLFDVKNEKQLADVLLLIKFRRDNLV